MSSREVAHDARSKELKEFKDEFEEESKEGFEVEPEEELEEDSVRPIRSWSREGVRKGG